MRERIGIPIITILALSLLTPAAHASSGQADTFAHACRTLGVHISASELHASQDNGYELLQQFARIAEKHKLHAKVLKIGLDRLDTLNTPAIAMLWDTGLVEINPNGNAGVYRNADGQSTDGESSKYAYSGIALVLAKDPTRVPKPMPGSPDLRPVPYAADFGAVDQGISVTKTVKLRNFGDKTLQISSVRASCGCIPVQLAAKTIEPGGETDLRMTFNSANQQGLQHHKVYIQSNDPVTPITEIRFIGMVLSPRVSLYPRNLDFGIVRKGQSASQEITAYDSGGYDFQVKKVASDSPFITATIASDKDREHPRFRILVTLSPDAPVGDFKAKLTVTTTHPKEPTVEVPIAAEIKQAPASNEYEAFFGAVQRGTETQRIITISPGALPLLNLTVDNPLKNLTVQLFPKEDGGLSVTITLGKDAPAGMILGDIVIHTKDPSRPIIRIKAYASVLE